MYCIGVHDTCHSTALSGAVQTDNLHYRGIEMNRAMTWIGGTVWMLALPGHGTALGVELAAVEGGTEVSSGAQAGSFDRVKALLEARGWRVQRDPEGNLILAPKGSESGQTREEDPLAGLAQTLANTGWRVERSARGELLLYPRATGETEEVPTKDPAESSELVPANDLERLQSLLAQKGWRVKRDREGNLLAYPATAPGGAPPRPGAEQVQGGSGLEQLEGLLRERGWRTERDAQGNLILYPRGSSPARETPAESSLIPATDLDALKARLQARGWTVQGDATSGLTIFAQGAQGAAVEPAKPGACQSVIPAPVLNGEVTLPVDSWDEAHAIAAAWLDQSGREEQVVGKIRRIHRIYLVSLVAKHPPYRLQDQLAIRARDGRTVALLQ